MTIKVPCKKIYYISTQLPQGHIDVINGVAQDLQSHIDNDYLAYSYKINDPLAEGYTEIESWAGKSAVAAEPDKSRILYAYINTRYIELPPIKLPIYTDNKLKKVLRYLIGKDDYGQANIGISIEYEDCYGTWRPNNLADIGYSGKNYTPDFFGINLTPDSSYSTSSMDYNYSVEWNYKVAYEPGKVSNSVSAKTFTKLTSSDGVQVQMFDDYALITGLRIRVATETAYLKFVDYGDILDPHYAIEDEPLNNYNFKRPVSLTIDFYGNALVYEFAESEFKLEKSSGIKETTTNVYKLPDNELTGSNVLWWNIHSNTKELLNMKRSTTVLNGYINGKTTAEILCSIGDYKDTDGNLCVSAKTPGLPMVIKVGDIVEPYRFTADGDVPIFMRGDRAAHYEVIKVNYIYDGAVWQKLILQEI